MIDGQWDCVSPVFSYSLGPRFESKRIQSSSDLGGSRFLGTDPLALALAVLVIRVELSTADSTNRYRLTIAYKLMVSGIV